MTFQRKSHMYSTKCGLMVRKPDMKCVDPKFKYSSDHRLDLFHVLSGSTPWLTLCMQPTVHGLPVGILNILGLFE